VTIHARVLEAALRLCREGGGWTFRPLAVVAVLGDLNPGSVRTHVMSRCCVNAPSNHAHRWPYFRRVRRGIYQILPAWRRGPRPGTRDQGARHSLVLSVSESAAAYDTPPQDLPRTPGPDRRDPVIARYMRDVDRTLIRQSLRMTHEQRLGALQDWMNDTETLQGSAARGAAGAKAAVRRGSRGRRRVS